MSRPVRWLLLGLAGLLAGTAGAIWLLLSHLAAGLPSVDSLRALQLSVPLRILSADGKLIGEFGAERRALLKYDELPEPLVQAFLAAEDDRFFEHPGVDWQGLARAALVVAASGEKSQGGSTITMQLARNVFLTSERSYVRKLREILLSLRIERELSKQEILELYLNKIYLGERAYGVGAAALIYFGKDVQALSLAENALIAGLPKAPSRDNPVANPQRAQERRDYVLRRMRELQFISELEYEAARAEPVVVQPYRAQVEVEAHYVAEMVRAELYAQYGEELYARGLTVSTTIDSVRQRAADEALRRALLDYDSRHGWRGPEARLGPELLTETGQGDLQRALESRPPVGGLVAGAVVAFGPEQLRVLTAQGLVSLAPADYAWARLSPKKPLVPGDVVRLRRQGEGWRLAQLPLVQGALVALDPVDGAITALSGGFDFFAGKFNRVTQARRQVGSGFKPFLYAAGLAYGFTPASVILDAPVVFDDPGLESAWRPENYGGDFKGPMRLREALVESRNLVSIRLLQAMGLDYARDYVARFGLARDRLPRDLTMALGTADYTPLELARGYATIANGGFLVDPWFIREIRDGTGKVLFTAAPRRACRECEAQQLAEAAGQTPAEAPPPPPAETLAPRAIEPQVAWLITDLMHDVTVRGTAARVAELGRSDLAGKTGTTNDETDAWFNGFQKSQVAVAWVGFDQPSPLGAGEVGGRAALPMWMDYMRVALKGVPQDRLPRPGGLVNVRINRDTGRLAEAGDPDALFETVQQDKVPETPQDTTTPEGAADADLEDLY
ncbi:MAG TPA: penicillin-binding protein 1A [Solimonas sp.]|nr:penicillin-binding protein 1A [Solimonas sp.]